MNASAILVTGEKAVFDFPWYASLFAVYTDKGLCITLQ